LRQVFEKNRAKRSVIPLPTGKAFSFSFVEDKIAEKGEDAPPILFQSKTVGCLAVFDGMGGAGSQKYSDTDNGDGEEKDRTAAFIAANRAREETLQFCMSRADSLRPDKDTVNGLRLALREAFDNLSLRSKPTPVKSKLAKNFPTTATIAIYESFEKHIDIAVAWAGDSRAYILEGRGLQALTIDDVDRDKRSPDDDLMQDGVMTNCLHADQGWHLNELYFHTVIRPVVLFTATDGCFGFSRTPIHFEKILLKALSESESESEWKQKIIESLGQITGDDMSLSLVALGFESFDECKSSFQRRLIAINGDLKELEAIERLFESGGKNYADKVLVEELETFTAAAWSNYRSHYKEKLINHE
jgi:hypothetical protein